MLKKKQISIVGFGNVGYELSNALLLAGISVTHICTRSKVENTNYPNTVFVTDLNTLPVGQLTIICVQDSEIENNHHISFRRGVYLKNPIKKGQEIKKKDLCFLRPAHGTDARDVSIVVGAKALKDLEPKKAIFFNKDYLPIGLNNEK